MSSKQEPDAWRPDPRPASASGGHVAPDLQPASRYDPLLSELTRQPVAPEEERPRPSPEPAPRPAADPYGVRTEPLRQEPADALLGRPLERGRRGRPIVRRVKRTVRHIDPGSILKLSLFFYAIFLVVWLIVVALVYRFVEGSGWLTTFEEVVDVFVYGEDKGNPEYNISLWAIERWAFLIGFTFVVVGSVVNVVLAFLYNLAADLFGGVEMTFVEKDV